jgi:hypothetical protein
MRRIAVPELKGASPEPTTDVGRFIAVGDLFLPCPIDRRHPRFLQASFHTDLSDQAVAWHVVEQLRVKSPTSESWTRVFVPELGVWVRTWVVLGRGRRGPGATVASVEQRDVEGAWACLGQLGWGEVVQEPFCGWPRNGVAK